MGIALRTDAFGPGWLRILHAAIFLGRGPGLRQRVVDRRDLDNHDVAIGLVNIDPFLEDTLVIGVQRQTGIVVGTWPLEPARLDFENIVLAGIALIDPLADRVAIERRLDEGRPGST